MVHRLAQLLQVLCKDLFVSSSHVDFQVCQAFGGRHSRIAGYVVLLKLKLVNRHVLCTLCEGLPLVALPAKSRLILKEYFLSQRSCLFKFSKNCLSILFKVVQG